MVGGSEKTNPIKANPKVVTLQAVESVSVTLAPDTNYYWVAGHCETDWAQVYPQYAVSTWIGHGIEVSARHYLQVPKELYDKVAATKEVQTATKSENKKSAKKRSEHKISS